MKVLIVVAHPDDEILGAGGTLIKHKDIGDELFIHILTDGHSSRITKSLNDKYSDVTLQKRIASAKKVAFSLKATDILIDEFDDQMLDTYPIIEITKSIESFSNKINPDIVYTHFLNDVNRDHQVTFSAVLNAFRPASKFFPHRITCIEILSSTEWGFPKFTPNYFVDISRYLEKKIELLSLYDDEFKAQPHPRSIEKIVSNAKKWGSAIYCDAAEAFLIIRQSWK